MIKKDDGFTIIEIMIVIAILTILFTVVVFDFVLTQKRTDLNNGVQEFVTTLKFAQSRAISSDTNSQYGVYLNTAVSPNQYVVFKGLDYASRDTSYDQNYFLPANIEFYAISLGGGSEVVFNKLTGSTVQQGSVSLRDRIDVTQNKTIYVSNSGTIDFNQTAVASDSNRVKDSRHVHFDYLRTIDTATENVVLTFDSTLVQVIPINAYLAGNEFSWEGTVNTAGSDQTVKIHAHRLNNTDTQFSITRDRRLNDRTLVVTISGDSSGDLASYSADGAIVNHTSIYASNFVWQ